MSIPTVPRYVSLRNMLRTFRNPLDIFDEYVASYGRNFVIYIGGLRKSILTTDPATIQHVLQRNHRNYRKSEIQSDEMAHFLGRGLLTNNGEDWLRQRRLIQPGFHRERIASLGSLMQEVITAEGDRLAAATHNGRPVDITKHCLELAFRIMTRTLFSESIDEERLRILSENVTRLQEFIIKPIRLPFLKPYFRLTGEQQTHERISRQSFDMVDAIIQQRKASGERHDDLLQMLLDTRYEDTGEPMTDDRLLEEIVILLVAGHETSANALSWTFYLLSKHPEILDRLRQELNEAVGDRAPTTDELRNLPYLTQVIEESMRLYPPAWIIDRVALTDDAVGDLRIEAGDMVAPYVYGLHRHPDLWDRPDEFDPDRFSEAAKRGRHPYAYIPFGGGPRLCIGHSFALLEMQLTVADWARRFTMTVLPEPIVAPQPLITLRPKEGIRMRMEQV